LRLQDRANEPGHAVPLELREDQLGDLVASKLLKIYRCSISGHSALRPLQLQRSEIRVSRAYATEKLNEPSGFAAATLALQNVLP
jgi:hypothetical protein